MEEKENCFAKETRQMLLERCQVILNEPTRFNIRRLVALAQCIVELDTCLSVEEYRKWDHDRKRDGNI